MQTMVPKLILVRESKICELMPRHLSSERWEASGVLVKDQHYFVVFDDRSDIARITLYPDRGVCQIRPESANSLT